MTNIIGIIGRIAAYCGNIIGCGILWVNREEYKFDLTLKTI